jgi:UDP-galactopyranose mutase
MNQLFKIKTINGMRSYFPTDNKQTNNFEEEMISKIGEELYDIFIREYTEKKWKMDPKLLPKSLVKRIPIRFSLDDHYFNDKYEGIPENGYTNIFEKLLSNCDVKLNTPYSQQLSADKIVYTGKIDEYHNYSLGKLEYVSLEFKHKYLDNTETFQGISVLNYPQSGYQYTRIIEHKYFNPKKSDHTVITEEYSLGVNTELEPYYPVNTEKNDSLYQKYKELNSNVIFGGRLGEYKYIDMDKTILSALELSDKLLCN